MNKRRGIKLSALLVAGLVFLTACSNGKTNQSETRKETVVEQNTETQKETKVEETKETETTNNQATASKVDVNRAVAIFHDTFSDKAINITQIDYDRDNGRYTYEIEGWKDNQEYKIEIDAETEEILKKESEMDDDIDRDKIVIELDKITSPEKAIEEALKQAKATKIEGWDLDTENGVLVYEIDVEDGKDVVISADDGAFIKFD
ncbi:PepSY domain-containing protein [uncultured Helcococcus sp.]|uniref:PepSY domain-containing protein n=1 Tax=uncultured Helcococcus sp. TaxID=1072508 RepID=UPI0028890C46|nr:PepSY domain-containing protein [uncultured Helcococcus sp.]